MAFDLVTVLSVLVRRRKHRQKENGRLDPPGGAAGPPIPKLKRKSQRRRPWVLSAGFLALSSPGDLSLTLIGCYRCSELSACGPVRKGQAAFSRSKKAAASPPRLAATLAEAVGFEPTRRCRLPDFECCKTLADSRLEQVVSGRFVKCRKPRRRKELRTFRPVSARADLNQPRVQIKSRSCVKNLRSCAFARSQARKPRPQQRQ